jgi:monoterpene epsilon-lactone hydrolase
VSEPSSAGPAGLPSAPWALVTEARSERASAPSLLPPAGIPFGLPPAVLRRFMGLVGGMVFDPAVPVPIQRRRLALAARSLPRPRWLGVLREDVGGRSSERLFLLDRRASAGAGLWVHFHGGGYCVGGPFVARGFVARVLARCRQPLHALLPTYRLAPEDPFPAALDDALAVLRALDGQGPVVVSGDSAGAGLALAATLVRRDAGEPLPAGLVLHCPWVDLAADLDGGFGGWRRAQEVDLAARDVVLRPAWLAASAAAYCADQAPEDPRISPVFADLRGLPPVLIQAAGDDLLCPDARHLAARAGALDLECRFTLASGYWHDFGMQAGLLAAGTKAAEQVAQFLDEVLEAARPVPSPHP